MQIPYVGSDVHASACAMDKYVAKALFRDVNLPVSPEIRLASTIPAVIAAEQINVRFGTQVVIKPLNQGSAIGVTLLPNGGDLEAALNDSLTLGHDLLIEPYILGREMTVGVLDLEGETPVATPLIDIVTPEDTWYDYEHRYAAGLSQHVIPADVPDSVAQEAQRIALAAHEILQCRDLSRADLILTDSDELILLEVNTLPGMTPTSLYPDGLRALGISFEQLVAQLIDSALRRALSISQEETR